MLKIIKCWGFYGPGFLFQICLFACLFCLVRQWSLFSQWNVMQKTSAQCMQVELLWVDEWEEWDSATPCTYSLSVSLKLPPWVPKNLKKKNKTNKVCSSPRSLVLQIRKLRPRDWNCLAEFLPMAVKLGADLRSQILIHFAITTKKPHHSSAPRSQP